jgi:hypothetical protein
MFNYYYKNDAIRKLVIAFGTVFNSIYIGRLKQDGSTENIRVPLTYAPKEKYIKRLTQGSSISDNRTRIQIDVPQMAFEMTDIIYDPARKMNKMFEKFGSTGGVSYGSKMEVPYNFIFNLYVYTRNIDENLEIMEQILPYFSPEFIVSLNITNIHKKVDVPIIINKTVFTQEYEGDFSTRRMVISTYQFMAKSYIFGPVKSEQPIIRSIDIFGGHGVEGFTFDIDGS